MKQNLPRPQRAPLALTIAGSDPSGGAGLQADLKTFQAHGVHGCTVVSLLTAQSSLGVARVQPVTLELFAEQLDVLLTDLPPSAAKTGALASADHVAIVVERFTKRACPLVVDPVMSSKTGAALLDEAGRTQLRTRLLPLAALVTPNLDEAGLLLGKTLSTSAQLADAARELADFGARAVLIKGGHREGAPIDLLYEAGVCHELHAERIPTRHTHGVGCTLSAAICARLALGHTVLDACVLAKEWLTRAIASAPGYGAGQGGVNHLEPLERR